MNRQLSNIRTDFTKSGLWITDLLKDPLKQLEKWIDEAVASNIPEPTAMSLATVDAERKPHSRIVLLKGLQEGLLFFTNYNSGKGEQIKETPYVSALFFWPSLERQVQINGRIEKLPASDSDAYFASRPRESQIGAWASPQSEAIESYEALERRYLDYVDKFQGKEIPRPEHWGGYKVIPEMYEFWQGRPGRLHHRFKYIQEEELWKIYVVAP